MWQISSKQMWNTASKDWGLRQKHLSFRCPVLQHSLTAGTLKAVEVCLHMSGWAFVFTCAYVKTLKWDHRLNQAKALDTHPPLINSPIRKYLHWQKCRQGLIDGGVIRGDGFHRPWQKDSTCLKNMTQTDTERRTIQDGMRLKSVAHGCRLQTCYWME